MILENLAEDWRQRLESECGKPYFTSLLANLAQAYQSQVIYPPASLIFNAFNLCPFHQVKVVLIGQDPYHAAGQADGLCFSVNHGIRQPPSLKNIFKELSTDLQLPFAPASGNLEGWARQGVLMLNAILTVKEAEPGSHRNLGWENFTDAVIRLISNEKEHVVFLLWGNYALSKAPLINETKHLVLRAAHPSPLARGAFFGCRHFSRANQYLEDQGLGPINWSIT